MNKRRKIVSALLAPLVIAGLMLMPACASQPAAPSEPGAPAPHQTYKWRLQSFMSGGWEWCDERFADTVYLASDGRLDIEVFTAAEIVPVNDILAAVSEGIIEMGSSHFDYDRGVVDMAQIASGLPFAWEGYEENHELFRVCEWQDIVRETYAEHGIYHLCHVPASYNMLLATEKAPSLDELEGMVISSGDAQMWQELGVTAVELPWEELYTSLATGMIDGLIFGGPEVIYRSGWWEIAKYLYPQTLHATTNLELYVNQEAWDSLPHDLQCILQLCADYHSDQMGVVNVAMLNIFQDALVEECGVELVYFDDATWEAMQEAGMKLWDKEAAKSARCAKMVKILKDCRNGKYSERVVENMIDGDYWLYNYPLFER